MPDPVDPRLVAWRLLLQTHRSLVPVLGAELSDAVGLPLAAYDVLLQLAEAPERRMRLSTLADRVLLSPSGLSRALDRLEADGLVERRPDPSDRRGSFAVLTDCGYETLRRASPVHLAGVARHFTDHLDEREAALLAAVFRRVLSAQGIEVDERGRRLCD